MTSATIEAKRYRTRDLAGGPIRVAFSIAVPVVLYVVSHLGYLDFMVSIPAAIALTPVVFFLFWFTHRMCDYVELLGDCVRISSFNGFGKSWRNIQYSDIEEVIFDKKNGVVEISYRARPDAYIAKSRIEMDDELADFIAELGSIVAAKTGPAALANES